MTFSGDVVPVEYVEGELMDAPVVEHSPWADPNTAWYVPIVNGELVDEDGQPLSGRPPQERGSHLFGFVVTNACRGASDAQQGFPAGRVW